MRKFVVTAAVLGFAALGLALPATVAQAAESVVAGPVCDSKWGARNGMFYAWDLPDCQGELLIATSGNNPDWGDAGNRASSFMIRGYTGGRDHVALYDGVNYSGGYACLAPGGLYADNLTDNRLSSGILADNTISSHQWVTRNACPAFLT
ncbi:hypothetical protein [Streptomyces tailanensis]|uniref:hypothetical protein n=1 Tax=Streptomyces tailanensis TaxID=2569858 RepID=UPI00122DFC8B|nr:hypothetical protein [Streptomyces tailanensis]